MWIPSGFEPRINHSTLFCNSRLNVSNISKPTISRVWVYVWEKKQKWMKNRIVWRTLKLMKWEKNRTECNYQTEEVCVCVMGGLRVVCYTASSFRLGLWECECSIFCQSSLSHSYSQLWSSFVHFADTLSLSTTLLSLALSIPIVFFIAIWLCSYESRNDIIWLNQFNQHRNRNNNELFQKNDILLTSLPNHWPHWRDTNKWMKWIIDWKRERR
jgi:hypothetical protein